MTTAAELHAPADVLHDEAHPFTKWLREFESATHGVMVTTLGDQTIALNAWNAALDAAARAAS